jgi:hypothetical protein
LGELIRDKCLSFVFPVEKKGVRGMVSLGYTFISVAFNFVVSMITVLQFMGITNLSGFLLPG